MWLHSCDRSLPQSPDFLRYPLKSSWRLCWSLPTWLLSEAAHWCLRPMLLAPLPFWGLRSGFTFTISLNIILSGVLHRSSNPAAQLYLASQLFLWNLRSLTFYMPGKPVSWHQGLPPAQAASRPTWTMISALEFFITWMNKKKQIPRWFSASLLEVPWDFIKIILHFQASEPVMGGAASRFLRCPWGFPSLSCQ